MGVYLLRPGAHAQQHLATFSRRSRQRNRDGPGAQVHDPAFQDRYVAETRALLATV